MASPVGIELDIANHFKPYFIFSHEEIYYPCSVEHIIANSQLYKDNELIKNYNELTPEILSENIGNNLKIDPKIHNGQISHSPIYYYIRPTDFFIDVIYFLYFAYSGPYTIFGKEIGHHDSDLEHITLRIKDGELIAIYFSAHDNDGRWIPKKDIRFIDKSPLIYVAKYSHAMYHDEGTHWRLIGLANDKTDFGLVWTTEELINVDPLEIGSTSPCWLGYKGKWSKDGVDSLVNRRWWVKETDMNSNFLTRMFNLATCCMDEVEFL